MKQLDGHAQSQDAGCPRQPLYTACLLLAISGRRQRGGTHVIRLGPQRRTIGGRVAAGERVFSGEMSLVRPTSTAVGRLLRTGALEDGGVGVAEASATGSETSARVTS